MTLHPDIDPAERGAAADIMDRPPPVPDQFGQRAGDLLRPARDWPRRHAPRAPGLGAPPSYLEVGLWKDRMPVAGDGAGWRLNPALRIVGDEIVVPDPVTGIEALFVAGEAMRAALARIAAEPASIDRLPYALRERLAALGVLQDDRAVVTARAEWGRRLQRSAKSFRADGYAQLSGLCCPAVIAFLRQRYRRMTREASLSFGDPQCPTRWIAHNEEAALPLHAALVPVVSAVVGRRVMPSYLYLGAYAEGSALPRHTDREQCEITLSLLIDYLPDLAGPSPWPLHMYVDDEPLPIYQSIGQAVIFGGQELAHARPPLSVGHMSSSIFFHFVCEDFSGRLD